MRWHRLGLTYSAVASLAAAGFLTLRGEWIAPTVLSVVALVMVMVRFGIDADLRLNLGGRLASITPRRERVGSVLIAGLLVTAALGAPLGGGSTVEPAAAIHDCSTTEKIATFSFGVGGLLGDQLLNDGKCSDSHRAQAIEDMNEADAEQTHYDIYSAGSTQRKQYETGADTATNYAQDTDSVAWMKAEAAVAEAYNNGKNASQAKAAGKAAIEDYYVTKQIQDIKRFEVIALAWNDMYQRAKNESNLNQEDVITHRASSNWDPAGTTETTVTLANGTSYTYTTVRIYNSGGTNGYSALNLASDDYQNFKWFGVSAPPDTNFSNVRMFSLGAFDNRFNGWETQSTDLKGEVSLFVDNTYPAFQSGEIDASDLLSRNTQMFEYGTTADRDDQYTVTAALSGMGLAAPQLNGTGTMTVQYNGSEYNGLALARNPPNGSWQVGTTYNTSNFSGPVLLATTNGETIELNGEFTVSSIKSEDGDDIQYVNTTKTVYRTTNTSELSEKLERIRELREEVESRQPKASGGGTTDSSGWNPFESLASILGVSVGATAALLAAAGVVVLKIYSPG